MRVPAWERRTWVALAAAAVAGVLVLVAAARALTVAALPAAEGGAATTSAVAMTHTAVAGSLQEIPVVLRADPFSPDRRAPATRFRFPGEPAPNERSVTVAALKLIGVALIADGRSFALVQAGSDAPRLVRVGEQVGGYTLRRVDRDRAVFAGPDGKSQEYRVTKAGT